MGMGAVETGTALTPRLSLTVGITGHRPRGLVGVDLERLRAAIGTVLDRIAAARGAGDAIELRLVSNLAEGADSLAANEALTRGWMLDAVLPFAHADYAGDFGEGAPRASFEQCVAASRAVFELPGDRTNDGESAAGYERAGRVVLAQSDLVVAIWDGGPARGRGGTGQIVGEAVMLGIPVIQIVPARAEAPLLLWDGLEEHDLGQQTVDTVPRADLSRLPELVRQLVEPPVDAEEQRMLARFEHDRPHQGPVLALAYPLLLAVAGVRRPRAKDFWASRPPPVPDDRVAARFARADMISSNFAQQFRSGYTTNFAFAALAVVLSLMGLVLPPFLKPVLVVAEVLTIGVILVLTRLGNRAGWHRRWLDNRHLAERLRCLAISSQLGDLDLRADADKRPGWVSWYARATAREVGLPQGRVDTAWLERVRTALLALMDDQIAYLGAEARRMHTLEHRLHLTGTGLFAATALICVVVLLYKVADTMAGNAMLEHLAQPAVMGATILSAALPAIGAAIYGIRMQGDFAGTAGRSEALGHQLTALRKVVTEDELDFDTLFRRTRRVSDLLTEDLTNWLQTYNARPLSLPG